MATPATASATTYPAVGEVFTLTLDGDDPNNQPLAMVRRDGYTGQWHHSGTVVTGSQTKRFKLVQASGADLAEVKRKLAEHGDIPEGQWREAFKAAYPTPDGTGPIGVADDSWVSPDGRAFFPYVFSGGDSGFLWPGLDYDGRWRWLVCVDE